MKNILLGVALGVGAAGVVVAIVLVLSGGDDETTAVQSVPATSPATATPPGTGGSTSESAESTGSGTAGAEPKALASVQDLARAYCAVERRDPDDFQREFGTGEQAMATCIEREIAAAARECEADRLNDPGDYELQFGGSDEAAFQRCLKYELRSF